METKRSIERSKKIVFWTSPEQYEGIKKVVKQQGQTVASFLRSIIYKQLKKEEE